MGRLRGATVDAQPGSIENDTQNDAEVRFADIVTEYRLNCKDVHGR